MHIWWWQAGAKHTTTPIRTQSELRHQQSEATLAMLEGTRSEAEQRNEPFPLLTLSAVVGLGSHSSQALVNRLCSAGSSCDSTRSR